MSVVAPEPPTALCRAHQHEVEAESAAGRGIASEREAGLLAADDDEARLVDAGGLLGEHPAGVDGSCASGVFALEASEFVFGDGLRGGKVDPLLPLVSHGLADGLALLDVEVLHLDLLRASPADEHHLNVLVHVGGDLQDGVVRRAALRVQLNPDRDR